MTATLLGQTPSAANTRTRVNFRLTSGMHAESLRAIFARRLSAWTASNAVFLYAADVVHADEEAVGRLHDAAQMAYRALLATPAPDALSLLEKLRSLTSWHADTGVPLSEVDQLGVEAAELLKKEGR